MIAPLRYAEVTGGLGATLDVVQQYLPSNYSAEQDGDRILITGRDSHGWTLDDYVIPRLGSGLIVAVELVPQAPELSPGVQLQLAQLTIRRSDDA